MLLEELGKEKYVDVLLGKKVIEAEGAEGEGGAEVKGKMPEHQQGNFIKQAMSKIPLLNKI